MAKKALTYNQAFKEIEEIISKVENDEIDVDSLINDVKKASLLINYCKDKLRQLNKEVETAFEDGKN